MKALRTINISAIGPFTDCERRGAIINNMNKRAKRKEMRAAQVFRENCVTAINRDSPPDWPDTVTYDRDSKNKEELTTQISHAHGALCRRFEEDYTECGVLIHDEELDLAHQYDILSINDHVVHNYIISCSTRDPIPGMALELALQELLLKRRYPKKDIHHVILNMIRSMYRVYVNRPEEHPVFLKATAKELGARHLINRMRETIYEGVPTIANPGSFRCTRCPLNNDVDCPQRAKHPFINMRMYT